MKIPFHPDSLKMYKEYCERNFDILKIKMILKSLAQKKQAVDFTLPGKCCLPKMCQLSIVLSVIVRNRQKSFPQKICEGGVIFRNSQALCFHEPSYFLINK